MRKIFVVLIIIILIIIAVVGFFIYQYYQYKKTASYFKEVIRMIGEAASDDLSYVQAFYSKYLPDSDLKKEYDLCLKSVDSINLIRNKAKNLNPPNRLFNFNQKFINYFAVESNARSMMCSGLESNPIDKNKFEIGISFLKENESFNEEFVKTLNDEFPWIADKMQQTDIGDLMGETSQ